MSDKFSRFVCGVLLVGSVSACSWGGGSRSARPEPLPPLVVRETPPPGTVLEPWEEPMPDVVEVPDQLDPTGTYYLPRHKQVIEVRPSRYKETDYGEGTR